MKDRAFAGTAVVAKGGVNLGDVADKFDHSPSASLGRLAAARVQAGPATVYPGSSMSSDWCRKHHIIARYNMV